MSHIYIYEAHERDSKGWNGENHPFRNCFFFSVLKAIARLSRSFLPFFLCLSLSLLLVDRSTLKELGKLPAPRFSATFLARQPLVVSPSNSRSLFVVRETLVKSSSGDVPLFKRLFIECIQRRKFAWQLEALGGHGLLEFTELESRAQEARFSHRRICVLLF